ncbi:hypothetical protein [Nocardia sp. CDC160]|uniref:hypothetical protein n=1 Tax=Nocardia sp. CDC160 TaxID=3112166 RepID=UPI002DBF424D|nr:hypothetical protein [Nocardia sp. CDC160]MEC3915937.1 hypothetical protein [Nocardia sp. CDC160]
MIATPVRTAVRAALAAAVVGTASFGLFGSLTIANAGGDYGPDTCLEGYVWREANAADHVCVSSATRDQTRADNAAAGSRKAGGGAYGPDTCVNGYVWREAYDGDVVCVLTATRTQAKEDNAKAADRKASLNVWLDWYNPGDKCDATTCTHVDDGGLKYVINGDHFNKGTVTIALNRYDGVRLATYTTTAGQHDGYAGGSFGYKTDLWDPTRGVLYPCKVVEDAYYQVYDPNSQRWSNKLPITHDCHR